MPYSYENYPSSYQALTEQTRRKAVDIVKIFLRQGMDEKQAIRIAHDQALAWAITQSHSACHQIERAQA